MDAKDVNSDVIPLLPLHPTTSMVSDSDLDSDKGGGFKQRQVDSWDIANTIKDMDKTQGHGHLVVTRSDSVSSDDVETLVRNTGIIMPADEEKQLGVFHKLTRTLWGWGIETHGCVLYPSVYLTFD